MGAADSRVAEDLKNSGDNEPSDGVLLSQLIQLLSRRQKHCLLLSDLNVLLPSSLRKRAKEHGGLKRWIQTYSSLFQVTGETGQELVILAINASAPTPISEKFLEPNKNNQADSPGQTEPQQEPDPGPPPMVIDFDLPEFRSDEGKISKAELNAPLFDEEKEGHLAIQLRGLPYKATVEDIRNFLGPHANNLHASNPVHLVMNRDGRPSGFARVLFATEEAARLARDELHLRGMEDRYVEVFLYPDRPSKGRSRRLEEGNMMPQLAMPDAAGISRDAVVVECRAEMSKPGNRRMLLSMLGVTLSAGARTFLKHTADQGLKHFLANYPNEFAIEGAKGCEYVLYTPIEEQAGAAQGTQSGDAASYAKREDQPPGSPSMAQSPGQQDVSSSNRVVATPSDWGTPAPAAMSAQGGGNWTAPPTWPGSNNEAVGGNDNNSAWPGNQWQSMPQAQQQAQQASGQGQGPQQPQQQQWQGWTNPGAGSFSGPWGDTASIEAAAQQGAATATAMSFGLDPQAIAAAVFYGATAAAMAAAAAQQNSAQAQAVANGMPAPGMMMPQMNSFPGGMGNGAMANTGANIRLRGLPYQSTEQDVLAFFAQHDVVDRIADGPRAVCLITRSNRRPSGQAIVQMRDRSDAELAQRILNGQWMGSRYIEVFLHEDQGAEAQQSAVAVATAAATAAGKFQQGGMSGFNGPGMAWQQPNMWGHGPGQTMPDNTGQNGDWQALFSFLGDAQQAGATAGRPGFPAQSNENVNGAVTHAAVV